MERSFNVRSFRLSVVVTVALAAVTAWIFWPVRGFDFVNYDDPKYFTENRQVLSGLTADGVRWAFSTGHASNWHPLTWLSLMLDVELFGPEPRGPHFTNLLLHVANTVLLFAIFRRMTGALWRSAVVAALFALHPLHVESVAWVAERKDVLSTFLGFLSLFAYVRFAQLRAATPNPEVRNPKSGMRWYAAALLFFLPGLMAKPMLVTLPFAFLLLDYWPLGRISFTTPRRSAWRTTAAKLVFEKWPFFAGAIASSVVTLWAQKEGGSVQSLEALSFGNRLANATVAYAGYLGKMFWPDNLAVFYPRPESWPALHVALSIVLLLGVTTVAIAMMRRFPPLAVGWFWYLGMLVPVIGLVQVGDQAMADRYTYLPLIGIFAALTWMMADLCARWRFPRFALGAVVIAVLVACGVQTRRQLAHWRNSETLLRHALAVTSRNHLAHYNLGNLLLERGDLAEAIVQLEGAVIIRPQLAEGHNNLALALRRSGQPVLAEARFRRALEVNPNLAIAHNGYANLLVELGRSEEALEHYRNAIENDPELAEAHFNLALALSRKGVLDEAVLHYQQALALRPDLAPAYANLGGIYLQTGKQGEAIAAFRKAVALRPEFPEVQNNLRYLAWVLATSPDAAQRNGVLAVELAEDVNAYYQGRNPEVVATLAAAYAEAARFSEAIRAGEHGLQLAIAAGNFELESSVRAHLQNYRAGQPTRDHSLSRAQP